MENKKMLLLEIARSKHTVFVSCSSYLIDFFYLIFIWPSEKEKIQASSFSFLTASKTDITWQSTLIGNHDAK